MADSSRRTGAAIEAHYRSVARLAADGHASADDESASYGTVGSLI